MHKATKILIRAGIGAAVLMALIIGTLLLLPRLLDMDAIGRNALATLESRYHIHSEQVEITFFPLPRAIVHGTRITVPEVLTASVDSVAVYPKILPLLSGKFRPAEIQLIGPKVSVKLPESAYPEPADDPAGSGEDEKAEVPEKSEKTAEAPDKSGKNSEKDDKAAAARFTRLMDRLVQLQATLAAAIPGIVLDIDGGIVEIYSDRGRVFWFHEIASRATMLNNRIDFEFSTGKSSLWNAFTLNGWVNPSQWKGSGELNLTGGTPRELVAFLFPSTVNRIGNSQVDATVTYVTNGLQDARADFNATVSNMDFEAGEEKVSLQNGSVAGSLSLASRVLDVTLSRFRFDEPRANLTGRYTQNFAEKTVALDLEGLNTDAAAVREALLVIDSNNKVLHRIFQIILDGEVPVITYSGRGSTPGDLKKMEHYTIQGTMQRGTIFAPKVDLIVSDVWGEVVVTDGILYGTSLTGKTEGSSTTGGSLKIGLRPGDVPFHLDLPIDADLSELPDVLNRVVKSEAFKDELKEMKDIRGRTRGRLILGETLETSRIQLETGPFQLSGSYSRIPDPIAFEGASFSIDGTKMSVHAFAGKSGRSSFSQAEFSFDWEEPLFMELSSEDQFTVSTELVEPLLRARQDWIKGLKLGDAPLKGLLHLDPFSFKGPLRDRSQWTFSGEGSVENLTATTGYLTGPVTLKAGKFEFTKEVLTLKSISTSLGDSSLLLSGPLNGYFDKMRSVDLTASGRLGPVGNRDIASLAEFPPSLRAIADLTLERSRLTWEKDKTAFEGEMVLTAGPAVKINIVHTPRETTIEDLVVKDADSDATIALKFKEKSFKVGFSGSLSNRTADKLLSENNIVMGPIQGKFKARFYLDEPRRSTARGQIKISGFQLPEKFRTRIESATLEAAGNRINVKSAMISWNGTRFSIGGGVTMAEDAYLVNLNAFADTLDLEKLIKESRSEETGTPPKGWEAPIRGVINVRGERIRYGQLTWNPANADVVISPGSIEVKVNQANLCGISTPGKVVLKPGGTKLVLTPEARDQDLEPMLACLFDRRQVLTGKFTLNGSLTGDMEGAGFVSSLDGDIDLKARDGRIYKMNSFVKIMSLLSITEIYRGKLPDLFTEGCEYETISVKGKIIAGKLVISESLLDGPCVRMVFRGEIDFAKQKMDVVALVSPLRTVDRVIGKVPLVNKILDGGLISVPVRISGNLSDPSVIPLSPTAVGEELYGFMKRTFKLPFTLLQPLADAAAQNSRNAQMGRNGKDAQTGSEGGNGSAGRNGAHGGQDLEKGADLPMRQEGDKGRNGDR